MFIDGRTIGSDTPIECDVCVVGAGPAGLAVARELLSNALDVCVVESGGFEPDARAQALGNCLPDAFDSGSLAAPDLYPNPMYARSRRVGGSSDQWDVPFEDQMQAHLHAFDPIDFRRRDWLPHSGWPIDEQVLAPYYRRAHEAFGGSDFTSDPDTWISPQRPIIRFDSGRIDTHVLTNGRQSTWMREVPEALRLHPRARLITHATAVDLPLAPGSDRVRAVSCRAPGAGSFEVRAAHVVLAQGGFEVPRLLLASRGDRPAGLGNGHDLVGRFLMDRQLVKTGTLVPSSREGMRRFGFYDSRIERGRFVLGKFKLSDRALESERILSAAIGMSPMPARSLVAALNRIYGRETTWRSRGFASLQQLIAAARERRLPPRALHHLLTAIGGLDDTLYLKVLRRPGFQTEFNRDAGGWSALPDLERRFVKFEINQVNEQAPDPDNRITLGEERDALGMPLSHVRMRLNEIDLRSAARTQQVLAEEFARAGLGTLRFEHRDGEPLYFTMSTHHPAGTARMSAHEREGVVDRDCRVHAVSNLYVASSAVFPTGGCFPPTLTIVALAIRVADQVREAARNVPQVQQDRESEGMAA